MKYLSMRCYWKALKAVIMLALISIAIHVRNEQINQSIRTLTSKPYVSFNATARKTHILVLATYRSGSSFMGQLLNQQQEVFYLFEPLWHVHTTLNMVDHHVKLGASRDLLRSLYDCDLYSLESYIKPAPVNHITGGLFRHGASRALCDAFGRTGNMGDSDCVCFPLNMTLAIEACRHKRHVVLKIVRVPEIGDLRPLVEDPRLNLKVIQLVRDPRGILSSMIETFDLQPDNRTGRYLTAVCDDFLSSVSTGLGHPPWLNGKYMLVRYEDLARNPLLKSREIYDYLGLPMDKDVEDWIQASTRDPSAKHKFGTVRDSAATAESWRLKLPYDMVEHTQVVCQKVLHQLGYKTVRSAEELKNMSLSLVQDKTFVPFL